MFAEIKRISSPDIDLLSFEPEDDRCFGFLLELEIGTADAEGADIFQLMVCTPQWIEQQYAGEGSIWGRGMLIVFGYDISEIQSIVRSHIGRCTAPTWEELAVKLNRITKWEFEDYRP
ncbi:hypothetical protein BAU07_13345 [Bordetella flabilis]|uniref:Immunity protein 8 n=1 Tax=Bordetella flabilis TaxID=463014 RepID=A0A193GME0_9BORD|nr:hypothetical protein BAU07_13345 [Bordetella flabilis]